MNEERAKQILEAMLMNDAPMQIFGFSWLEGIKEGDKITAPDHYNNKELGLSKWINALRREEETMRDTYQQIDVSRLDEEIGKLIVGECKPLIKEFYEQYFPLVNKYIESDFQPQEVPERLFEIRKRVMILSREYHQLEARKLYGKAWDVGYFNHNCETRMAWFIEGKPTQIHLEKLKLVLED